MIRFEFLNIKVKKMI